jgi:hypothetical protein
MSRFEFESRTFQWCYFYICSYGESRLLVSWCICDRCNMVSSDEHLDMSRRPSVEDQG